jgi:hypothetical protein
MKHSLSLTLLFVALLSVSAFGDHLYLAPNCCGDNFAYAYGSLILSGGTDPSFLSADGYTPGYMVTGGGTLYLNSIFLPVNGQQLEFFFYPGSISMTPFTLPTNGSDFRVLVDINFSVNGVNYDTGQTIFLQGGSSGAISFAFSPANGLYYPSPFVEAPEPGTLGLVATGFVGIVPLVRKRFVRH